MPLSSKYRNADLSINYCRSNNVTANYYSHLDYKSRISSAEVISNALGDEEDENEGEKKNAGSN